MVGGDSAVSIGGGSFFSGRRGYVGGGSPCMALGFQNFSSLN